jgi:hypothetical protein
VNYLDMSRAVDKIESRWGHAKTWENWESLTEDFAHFTAGAFMEALEVVYRSGQRYAPSPSEMMKRTSEVQVLRIERGIDQIERNCNGAHVWADPWPTDEDRHRTCVLCGEIGALVSCDHSHRTRGVCSYCLDGANA